MQNRKHSGYVYDPSNRSGPDDSRSERGGWRSLYLVLNWSAESPEYKKKVAPPGDMVQRSRWNPPISMSNYENPFIKLICARHQAKNSSGELILNKMV